MLNTTFSPGERIVSGPAGCWWRGQLWLAYLNLSGLMTLRSVPVLGNPATSQAKVVGLDARGECSLTEWGDRLWLAYSDPNGQLNLSSSSDGQSFSAPLALGGNADARPAIAGTAAGLWLAWVENAGGLVHLLRSDDGSAFTDLGISVTMRGFPALAADHENRRLAFAWTERAGGPHSATVASIEIDDPDPGLPQRATTPTPHAALALAGTYTGGHGGRRLLLASEEEGPGPGGQVVEGRTVVADLTGVGGAEAFGPGRTLGLSLASSGSRVWAAWRSAFQDDLVVAPYDIAFDLPQELLGRLGEPCDPKLCPPDPRLVCEATERYHWVYEQPHIPNARRGDLVLTPADGVGLVGTLLGKVTPPQFYDHMGIMLEDRTLIRQATMAHDRVKNKEYHGGSILGQKAPTDGIRPDLLRYGWPGTITQTVEDAFYTGFNTMVEPRTPSYKKLNQAWDYYNLNPDALVVREPPHGAPPAAWEAFNRTRLFFDPERPADGYSIHNFPHVPAYHLGQGQLIHGLVVKPDPAVEAQDPEVRASLHRVAAETTQIHGHYRFFAYSRSKIALEPGYRAPPANDPSWPSGLADGAKWAAGTDAVVCSTFIWAAVKRVGLAGPPRLELEGPVTESPEEQLATPSEDGLYRYTEAERRDAAAALYAYVSEDARKQVREKLLALSEEYEWAVTLSQLGIGAIALLLAGPVGLAVAVLGASEEEIADLSLLFNDMPDDLGNQMCNVFASDQASAVDSDAWESPGDGLAVSPDDIWRFWDPPGPPRGREIRHGLWGQSERLLLVEGRTVPRRVHELARSSGVAIAWGKVLYDGEPLTGAEVQIGCDEDLTRLGRTRFPSYYLEVPAGRHEIIAGAFWPASNWWLTGHQLAELSPGENEVDVVLEPPPDWRRIVRVFGKVDIVHRVLFGSDDWHHQPITLEARMAWTPNDWGTPPPGDKRSETFKFLSGLAGPERVHMSIVVWLNDDLSVGAGISAQHLEDFYGEEDDPDMYQHVETGTNRSAKVPADGSVKLTIDSKSADWPPDRSHIEVTIANERAPA